jgi:hypothetical protein
MFLLVASIKTTFTRLDNISNPICPKMAYYVVQYI